METTYIDDNIDMFEQQEGVFVGGSYFTDQEYLDLIGRDDYTPSLCEIMTYSSDDELSEFIATGDIEERRAAQLEVSLRECEKSF